MLDLLSLVLIGLFAWLGWRRGLVGMAVSLGGLALGYAGAYLFYRPVGQLLGEALGLQPLLSYPLGGLLVLLAVVAVVQLGWRTTRGRRQRQRARTNLLAVGTPRRGYGAEGRRPLGGALVGASLGLVVVLPLAWSMLLLEAVSPIGALSASSSVMGRMAAPAAGTLTYAVVRRTGGSEQAAATAARMARQPGATGQGLAAVLEDARVKALFQHPPTVEALARGDHAWLSEHAGLRKLASDSRFVEAARRAGMIDDGEGEQVMRQLTAMFAPMARVVVAIARDREVRRWLDDPQLSERLERRDLLGLSNDPGFNRLAAIVLAHLRGTAPAPPSAEGATGSARGEATPGKSGGASTGDIEGRGRVADERPARAGSSGRKSSKGGGSGMIYRWKDRKGVTHFSDRPPLGRVDYDEVRTTR